MKHTNIKMLTLAFVAISTMVLHSPLTSSDKNTKIPKHTEAYKKIIRNWNSDSWDNATWNNRFTQYGAGQHASMYKTADRKILVDAIVTDIRKNDLEAQDAVEILNRLRLDDIIQSHPKKIKATKLEHAEVLGSITKYIQTTFPETDNAQATTNYLKNTNDALDHALNLLKTDFKFLIKSLDSKELYLFEDESIMLQDACIIGTQLQKYNLLAPFDTFYNVLNVTVNKIKYIKHKNLDYREDLVRNLKQKSQSFMQSLYTNLPPSRKFQRPSFDEFSNINAQKITSSIHKTLEPHAVNIRRLHQHTTIENHLDTIKDSYLQSIVQRHLQEYTGIHDVRGEGNCCPRAVLGSIMMRQIDHKDSAGIQRLAELVRINFEPLFRKYAQKNSEHSYKLTIPTDYDQQQLDYSDYDIANIQTAMLQHLENAQEYRSIDQLEQLFNTHPEFDFFMIMFLRAMIAEEISKPERSDLLLFIPEENAPCYREIMLGWTKWIEDFELKILNLATGITINVIKSPELNTESLENIKKQDPNTVNYLTHLESETPTYGQADILFIGENHYKILRSKK